MKVAQKLVGTALFTRLMKATVYGQFAAGEGKEEIMKVVTRLRNAGVRTVLNYSAEEDNTSDTNEWSAYSNNNSVLENLILSIFLFILFIVCLMASNHFTITIHKFYSIASN